MNTTSIASAKSEVLKAATTPPRVDPWQFVTVFSITCPSSKASLLNDKLRKNANFQPVIPQILATTTSSDNCLLKVIVPAEHAPIIAALLDTRMGNFEPSVEEYEQRLFSGSLKRIIETQLDLGPHRPQAREDLNLFVIDLARGENAAAAQMTDYFRRYVSAAYASDVSADGSQVYLAVRSKEGADGVATTLDRFKNPTHLLGLRIEGYQRATYVHGGGRDTLHIPSPTGHLLHLHRAPS